MIKRILLASIIMLSSTMTMAWGFNKEFNKQDAIQSLQNGGMIVFVRHAYAPGRGDPEGVRWEDCSTQRNIKSEGIRQSKEMGKFLIAHNIVVEKALSSPMCRCYQTGELMGLDVEKNKLFVNKKNIDGMKDVIKKWNGKGNLFVFTHYTVMNNLFPGFKADSGTMLVIDNTNKEIKRVGSIHFEYDLMNKQ